MNVFNTNSPATGLLLFLLYAPLFNIASHFDCWSILDYAFKAILGSVIWLAFKLISERKKSKNKSKNDNE